MGGFSQLEVTRRIWRSLRGWMGRLLGFRPARMAFSCFFDAWMGLVRIIHAGDLLRIIEEESVLDGPLAKIQSRYRWLILNLG